MKMLTCLSITLLYTSVSFSQINLNQIKDKALGTNPDSLVKTIAPFGGKTSSDLSKEEVVAGLKEALMVGTNHSTVKLSSADGFFKDEAIKILMPEEAQQVAKKLRQLGMGSLVDKAILSMNRAAEDATQGTAQIFMEAIKNITIEDSWSILKGGNNAATDYLKKSTQAALTEKVRPVVAASLKKVNATQYWRDVFNAYNKVSAKKVNPDLTAYVVEKTLQGIFYSVAQEEMKIRKDPAARVTEMLKKVFE
jgi:hypothetical protein